MKLKVSLKTREIFAKKFLDLANIGMGALLFGQFIAERKFTKEQMFIGSAIVIGLYVFSFGLLKEGKK